MRRFSGRREVAVGLGTYAAYLLVRRLVVNERGHRKAHENCRRVVALEERLGIHVEPQVQRLLLPRRRLLAFLNVAYVTANVALTVGWHWLLFKRRDPDFHRLRRAVALCILGSQPFFLFMPTAPPRSQEGFVDTVGELMNLDEGLVVQLYNPIAAFPSIHLAFAVVTGAGLAQRAHTPLARAFGVSYPPAVFLTVVATGNHFVLDGVAGSALAAAALRLSR